VKRGEKMKKSEKYIYLVIGIIVIGIIAASVTFALLNDKETPKNDNNPVENNKVDNEEPKEDIKDEVKLIDIKERDDKVIQKFNVTLNGKNKDLEIIYSKELRIYPPYEDYYDIVGEFNNQTVYSNYQESSNWNIDDIKKNFNEDNFRIIKGEDGKSYLGIIYIINFSTVALAIYNDELELISKDVEQEKNSWFTDAFIIYNFNHHVMSLDNKKPWYEDTFNTHGFDIRVKIEDNKIYYFYFDFDVDGSMRKPTGTAYEKVYTINNNKLESQIINTYKITEVGNAD